MTKSFEEFLRDKFKNLKQSPYFEYTYDGWIVSLNFKMIEHAEQWSKESAPMKDDLDKDIHITNGIDKKHHIVREFKERIYNEADNPIDPAQARQKLDCIATMREALEKADHFIGNLDPEQGNYTYYALADVLMSIEQALKEESEQ